MRNNPRELLLNLHRQHVKAWEQKSFDHLRHLYSNEAVIFNTVPPPRFSDFKTFENTLQQYFIQIKEVSILTSNIQIEVLGDVAWITSQYLMAYHQNGQLVRQNGRWTEIYRQEEGEWKISHLHSSADPVEQAQPERQIRSRGLSPRPVRSRAKAHKSKSKAKVKARGRAKVKARKSKPKAKVRKKVKAKTRGKARAKARKSKPKAKVRKKPKAKARGKPRARTKTRSRAKVKSRGKKTARRRLRR